MKQTRKKSPTAKITHQKNNKKKKKSPAKLREDSFKKCDVCGMQTDSIHCQLICPRCGSRRDCSDP